MTDKQLEADLKAWINEGVPELRRLGYNPNRFLLLINKNGTVRTIANLVESRDVASGFTDIVVAGHPELTVEAIVGDDPRWNQLFTDEQRRLARKRLDEVHYKFRYEQQTAPTVGTDWSSAQCDAIVRDYFDMLAAEILGRQYNKAEHNRTLQRVTNRSEGSIEFKHANISAILIELQQPYIAGYKPRGNYQAILGDAVAVYLDENPGFFTAEMLAALEPTIGLLVPRPILQGIFDEPPEFTEPSPSATPWRSKRARRINFVEKDARNRALGRAGEEFTVALERRRLAAAGRDDLSGKVQWVADTMGDGLGYDVLSFNEKNGAERWLEVKTTTMDKYFPFIVTANELNCSNAEPERFNLFRVFEFTKSPRVFVLPGSLEPRCNLQPICFRAVPQISED